MKTLMWLYTHMFAKNIVKSTRKSWVRKKDLKSKILLTIQEDDGFSLEGTGSLLLDK
jgi:hypothetical protein